MRMLAVLMAALLLAPHAGAAEPAAFADLQGRTLEASWAEDMTWRRVGDSDFRLIRSPRQLTLVFGPGDAIKHQLVRISGERSRTENRQMQLNRTQPTGVGQVHWGFEDGALVYVETMFSGARRLVVAISKESNALSCTIAVTVAREDSQPIVGLGLDNVSKIEIAKAEAANSECRIGNP